MEEARAQAAIETLNRQILSVGEGAAPLTPDGLDRLRVLLEVHASELRSARAGSMALRGIAARSTAAVAAHLVNGPGPLALSRLAALLQISDDEGADRGPDEATATDYAHGVAAMAGWEASVGPDSRLRGTIQKAMAAITRTCRDRIDSHMQPNTDDDIPDVRLLARDILRIEAVEWAVEIAGCRGQAEGLRVLAHRAARQSVVWAGTVFRRFKAGPDEFSHFDAVATLSAVDDLLVVILRVLDSDRDDRKAGSHPFVLTLGEQAIQDFVDGLQHMTNRYLEMAEQNLLVGGAPGAFVRSVLLVLQRVLRLGHALLQSVNIMEIRANHEATLVRVVAMRAKLRAAQTMPGASRDLQTRLAVIEDALAEVGA